MMTVTPSHGRTRRAAEALALPWHAVRVCGSSFRNHALVRTNLSCQIVARGVVAFTIVAISALLWQAHDATMSA